MTNHVKKPFLVVSTSPYMRGVLKFVLETIFHVDVTVLESEERAISFLREQGNNLSLIIYDYTPNAYLVEDFILHLKEHSKSVKIIILVDEVREESKELLGYSKQMKLMDENNLPDELISEARVLLSSPPDDNEEEYCRIDVNFLTILEGINKNLFVRIGEDKFIKVFNEDDNTNLLDLKKYKEKGIAYLYVKRETAVWIINQVKNQINIFLKANNFRFILRGASDTPEKKFEQRFLRIDDEVHVDKELKETIDKAVDRIRAVVEGNPQVEKMLKVLKEKQSEYSFYTQKMNLTALMSTSMAKQLDWISKTTIDKLVFASVLSDITLAVRPELMEIPSISAFESAKSNLSAEDQKIFLSHPKDSANLVKRYFSSAPPDTDVLCLQHHELPDGKGFPAGTKADKISPLSALFIVANDFSFYFLKDDEPNIEDFLLKCHARYDYMNFRKVIKSLERIKKK